jgi:hypothetical protein
MASAPPYSTLEFLNEPPAMAPTRKTQIKP